MTAHKRTLIKNGTVVTASDTFVADVIIDALTARKPKDHYLTGSKSHIAAAVARLPEGLQDQLKRKAFGFPSPRSLAKSRSFPKPRSRDH
mgnify:CR=1 FL=1